LATGRGRVVAKRISIINFKGGVGKTTLAFNLAAGLARFHKPARVLAIDVDHQSSLSIVCLGSEGWDKAVKEHKTVDEVFRTFVGQGAPMPGTEIIHKTRLNSFYYPGLQIVPASLGLDDTEIELTASHQGNAIQSEWNKRTLICSWLEKTGVDKNFDYIIFDCPPATKIVTQNAIAASHGYIIPVVPEAVMERGAPHLAKMIKSGIDERLKAISKFGAKHPLYVKNTALVGVVVTRIKSAGGFSGYTDDHTIHSESLKRTWGDELLEPYIPDGTGISQTLSAGRPVYDWSDTQNIGKRKIDTKFKALTDELKSRIDAL
jgi:chromosome partitioning protein